MFYNFPHDFNKIEPAPGVVLHTVWGERVMFAHFCIKPNSGVPLHSHPHEQMGIILEGEFELTIGDETRLLKKGDMYLIPSNVSHGGTTYSKQALLLDAFSPPRENYQK